MDDPDGRGRAALIEDDAEFDARDAALLRAIARHGSVAKAASELGRSRARSPGSRRSRRPSASWSNDAVGAKAAAGAG
jgi:hypothetical protein